MNSIDEDDRASISSGSYGSLNFDLKQILCLSFGCFCIVIGIVDMIVLYVVPNNMAKNNKKKFPNATFSNPNKTIIAFHFVLHSLLIVFGVTLIIYAFFDNTAMLITMAVAGFLVLVFWIVHLAFSYKKTFNPKSQISSEEMQNILNVKNPIDFLFVYSKDDKTKQDCHTVKGEQDCTTKTETCYSRNGVKIPIITTVDSIPNYNFTEMPDMLFFTLTYDIKMTSDMKNTYDEIIKTLKKCDSLATIRKIVEYHPERNGTYIISKTKVPSALKQPSRIAAIIFGAGAYYEIYSKSFPSVSFTVTVNTAKDPSANYDELSQKTICNTFGSCTTHNKKPRP